MKHATGHSGMLLNHDSSQSHKLSMLSWSEFVKNSEKGTTIKDRIESSRKIQIEKNKHYLKTILEVLLLCIVNQSFHQIKVNFLKFFN